MTLMQLIAINYFNRLTALVLSEPTFEKKQWHAVVEIVHLLDWTFLREYHLGPTVYHIVTDNNGATAVYCYTIFNCYDLVLHKFFRLLIGLLPRIISRSSNHGNLFFSCPELPLFRRTCMYCMLSFFTFNRYWSTVRSIPLSFCLSLKNLNTLVFLCFDKHLCNMIIFVYIFFW